MLSLSSSAEYDTGSSSKSNQLRGKPKKQIGKEEGK
jgi:hypothetical protein